MWANDVFSLTATHRVTKRKWATGYRDRIQSERSQVLFKDKSRFSLECDTRRVLVLDESRSFFRVHTGYFSNIPKCIKAEFIASWACSQSSVVSSSQR
ncbi:hypothetical protein TNCV_1500621 [Trichonephila clavipes]|nr:hypothetical protein TNCV_1500621 [Trichonephila clavipes]